MKTLILFLSVFLFGSEYLSAQQLTYTTTQLGFEKNLCCQTLPATKKSSIGWSASSITFEKVQSFGSNQEIVIGKISDFAVSEGNYVFIADMDKTTIHVFNPGGSYRTSLGRQGSGPAEFEALTPTTTMTLHKNRLYVSDPGGTGAFYPIRAQVFDLANLSFSHTLKLIPNNRDEFSELQGYYPYLLYPMEGGNLLVSYHRSPSDYQGAPRYIRYFILDDSGNIVGGPVLEQKDRRQLTHYVKEAPTPYRAMHSFSFFEKSLLAVSNDDSLFTARSMDFEINVKGAEGRQNRSFQHSFENVSLKRDRLLEYYSKKDMSGLGDGVGMDMIIEAKNLPGQWPAISKMFFDDENRLWVATIVENFEVYKWWILKKSGEVITKFTWPRDKVIQEVRNGYLYTKEKDESGIEEVVKYKINMSRK